MNLVITEEETALLESVLEEYLGDLRMEVSNTHDYSFRQELKRKEEQLRLLIQKIERAGVKVT